MEVTFQITRHAYSYNNAVENPFHKEVDPSLTDYGVTTSLNFCIESKDRFNTNLVFVSPFIRTWMTAVLLYKRNDSKLRLFVTPHLKRHNENNWQLEINFQLENFKEFMEKIYKYTKDFTVEIIWPIDDSKTFGFVFEHTADDNWVYSKLLNNTTTIENCTGYYSSKKTEYNNRNYDTTNIWYYPNNYLNGGSLEKFTQWWFYNRETIESIGMHKGYEKVHVVAHSNLMKDIFRTIFGHFKFIIDQRYTDTNLWSLQYKGLLKDEVSINNMYLKVCNGVEKPDTP